MYRYQYAAGGEITSIGLLVAPGFHRPLRLGWKILFRQGRTEFFWEEMEFLRALYF
jgi:hypothetical protein